MQGTVENRNMELWLACTPKTRLVWKAQVAFKGKPAWNELKTQFDDMRYALIQSMVNHHTMFVSSAARIPKGWERDVRRRSDKVHFVSSWVFDDHSIRLEISTYQHVTMSCKNTVNRAIDCKEQQEITRRAFLRRGSIRHLCHIHPEGQICAIEGHSGTLPGAHRKMINCFVST